MMKIMIVVVVVVIIITAVVMMTIILMVVKKLKQIENPPERFSIEVEGWLRGGDNEHREGNQANDLIIMMTKSDERGMDNVNVKWCIDDNDWKGEMMDTEPLSQWPDGDGDGDDDHCGWTIMERIIQR